MSRKYDFQKIFRRNNFTFSHRYSGLVVRFSLREMPVYYNTIHENLETRFVL